MVDSVLISGSVSGTKLPCATNRVGITTAMFLLLLWGAFTLWGSNDYSNYTVDAIYFKSQGQIKNSIVSQYQTLLHFQTGQPFNYSRIRKSLESLYKIGTFENIEIRIFSKPGKLVDIQFDLFPKYTIRAIKLAGKIPSIKMPGASGAFNRKELRKAIFSIQENTYFEIEKLASVKKEVTLFLNARGYFNPLVRCDVYRNNERAWVTVKINVEPGTQTKTGKINVTVTPQALKGRIQDYFRGGVYVPNRVNQEIERVKTFLKKEKFYFPEVTLVEKFPGTRKTMVNLDITVVSGYRYQFNFVGMKARFDLISSIWEKNVFENWAEKECNARILYYLKNKGYLNAEVVSTITVDEAKLQKTITFTANKKRLYRLGEVFLEGNQAFPEVQLRKVMKTNSSFFSKFFHLSLQTLLVDREILRLYYYFQGYSLAQVQVQPEFDRAEKRTKAGNHRKLDITFVITEGKRFTIDSILFEGNLSLTNQILLPCLKSQVNGPYVEQRLNEDIDKLKNLYLNYGYDHIEITPVISPGTQKSILLKIKEGPAFTMGDLVVIGASTSQQKLIGKLFPLIKNQPFDRLKVEAFEREMEISGIFSQFQLAKIEMDGHVLNILIKATADYSKYYGFGIGWEGRESFRGTLEYQGHNIFNSYSTLSAMAQLGTNERRGIISFDTPFFFKNRYTASLKVWADTEVYPSYQFNRFGIGESLIKKLTADSYVMASLSWYRTELTHLEITPKDIDRAGSYFDTTALNFSYVRERRDDPVNPSRGSFLSADLKFGFPLFEKDYSFAKFQWSYQKNFQLLKNGVFAFSVRNGLATGGLSITERFFAGGVNSFRGRRRDRLGPIDDMTGKPIGGNAMVLFNLEATFPFEIIPIRDFYYTFFADIGNVFQQVKSIDFTSLEKALGFGIKYKTRMGPIRFDLAWDVNELFTWRNFRFHIGIGNVF